MKNKKKQSHGAVPGQAKRLNPVHPGTAGIGVRPSPGTGRNEIFERRAKSAVGRAFHVAATVDGRGPGPFSRPARAAVSRYTRLNRMSVNGTVKNVKTCKKADFRAVS